MSEPLPDVPAPQGAYVPAVVHRGLAVSAGMTPRVNGRLVVRGVVGADVDIATAQRAAGIATRNAIAAIADAAGGIDQIEQCLQLRVFISCTEGFEELSAVADGATAALAEHLGRGLLPARSAIGVRALPSGAPVEVELLVAVRDRGA